MDSTLPPDPPAVDPVRVAAVEAARVAWKGQLVDLGGRNTLLYYKDLAAGTLDLGPGSGADGVAVGALLASHPVTLSTLFEESTQAGAAKRARTIRAKAAENFEERGLRTLFLGWGMATWANQRGTATPAAPVLLRQAALTPRGRVEETFEVSLPEEWEVNPTLLYLLNHDFEVPADADLLDLLDDRGASAPDPTPVFERLTKLAATVPGFAITPRVVLGNFSYAKMPMVADLDSGFEALLASDLICAIAGHVPSQQAVLDRHPSIALEAPDSISPADEFLVLDADASQSYVINAAAGGGDLVVEGPPGTGKSQTIANLIATLAARGQRVLFVAEKRAAIDAVLGRLARLGLSDLVLDLHDGVASKRKLAQDLSRALADAASIRRPDVADLQRTLVLRRDELVARTAALYQPRDPWGVSLYDLQCRLTGIANPERRGLRLRGPSLQALDALTYAQAQEDLRAYANLGGLSIAAANSAWAAALAAGTVPTSTEAQAALDSASGLASHWWPQTSARLTRLAAECGLASPGSVAAWGKVLDLLEEVAATLRVFDPAVFGPNLEPLSRALAPAGQGMLARCMAGVGRGAYRAAKKQLRTWAQPGPGKLPAPELYLATTAALSVQQSWSAASIDGGVPRLPSDLTGTIDAYRTLSTQLRIVGAYAGMAELDGLAADALTERLGALAADTETLSKLPELTRLRATLTRLGLGPLLDVLAAGHANVDGALAALESLWLASILEYLAINDPLVSGFDGAVQDRTVGEYRRADRDHIASGPTRVRRAVAERITTVRDHFPEQSAVVSRQAALKQRWLPIRDLFQIAPDVLGALKPCWAMSPLVVSQLLPMTQCFDVVVFDEASQVTPADAIGALARAHRTIVAGDPHQLPPTVFFSASGGGTDDETPDDEWGASLTRDVESVLDQMAALLPPPIGTRTLGWHYRSRDERLIAFSNAQPSLYDYSLTTFPGVVADDTIRHIEIPFRPGRSGQEDSVSDEVTAVVELIATHARVRPTQSLGVIAMGIKHANRIEESLRRARRSDEILDAFVTGRASEQARREPLFVKNLERVQGDERDAIILTIGYGKGPDGRMQYRFGPLNNAGGERRLNVAITRARISMAVVSSFAVADLDPKKLNSEGAEMLGRYLAYVQSGGATLGDAAKSKPDLNPFERDVEAQLTKAGIPLTAQWGSSGYWIDYAAHHPTQPGRMVLAVECDGVSYHSSPTARDRDRLRQEHLERLGWRFHRIWSSEWFRHRDAEISRAVEAYRAAVLAADGGTGATPGAASPVVSPGPDAILDPPGGADDVSTNETARVGPVPVRAGLGSINAYQHHQLVALIRWIESDTLLRTEDQLIGEALVALGFTKRGRNIVAALQRAVVDARA